MIPRIFPKMSGLVAAGALAIALVGGAQAATVTLLASSTNGVGNTAHLFAPSFRAYTPVGASWDKDPTVTPPPGSVPGEYKSPFANTPLADTQSYFSVAKGDKNDGNGTTSPARLTFKAPQSMLKLLWGSLDNYQKIEFFSGATKLFSLTGQKEATDRGYTPPNPAKPQNYEVVELVKFSNFRDRANNPAMFDSVVFSSTGKSMEFALAPIPLPAGGLLLLTALGGVVMLRRRKAA